MKTNTKETITEIALKQFSENGYEATSMSDVANALGITKAALYKHFSSKREIFEAIVKKMTKDDFERAKEYAVPESSYECDRESYKNVEAESILNFAKGQFSYWTRDEFPSLFRRMLSLEQYRDEECRTFYRDMLVNGPVEYVGAILRESGKDEETARNLALRLYGAMFFMYTVYDHATDKDGATREIENYIDSLKGEFK